ncbi:coiled-coil domain-containing protein 8 isoform X2 [Apodemus sylvaticus]|uniref:coiled-coil domain-containing protein 8 isoform X2 n=1 Tax=Apodemus sylvaticus TaxID=10129 RepID=UPI00224195D0|nr:coiled-coil domain-containing protein 8 isoform X2 [Apodemus sylvaticus]
MLQIGEDVDHLLIPREVRLAGGVWRVISKPATKEAEFRERLMQFLQEEGRTLEDLARIIEKSTPHPPQPRKRAQEPRMRRVPQMVTPPLRLVVGTYDSSNGSDSDMSDFDTRAKGSGGTRKVRKMPVSYLGSKFLGSDVESEDDQELVDAFLRRGVRPSAPPPRRRVNLPVPMFDNTPGPQPSRADRWREYVSRVSWGKLTQRVKGWAPRPGSEVGQAQQASVAAAPGARRHRQASPEAESDRVQGAGCWKPKAKWVSLRRCRKEQVPPSARGTGEPAEERPEAAENQRAEAAASPRAEAAASPRAEAAASPRAEAAENQRAVAAASPRAEAVASPRVEAAASPRAEAIASPRAEAAENQRAVAAASPRAEATASPRTEAAASPRAEATDNQRAEAVASPRAEAAENQRAVAAASPRAEATDNQRAEAVANPRAEAADSPRAETAASPRADAVDSPRAEVIANPRAEATADSRAEAAASPRAEAADSPRAEAEASPRAEPVASPRAEAEASPRAEAEASPGAEAAANQRAETAADSRAETVASPRAEAASSPSAEAAGSSRAEAVASPRAEAEASPRAEAASSPRVEATANLRVEAAANLRAGVLPDQGAEAIYSQRVEGPANQRTSATENQRVEVLPGQREEAGPQAIQEASAGSGSRARKQVKTVRFQTPGRFSWFRMRRRVFWHTPRLPTLPKRVPKAGEARGLRVLRAEPRGAVEPGEREEEL